MYDIPIYFYMLSNISIFRNTTGQPMGVTEQGRFTFFLQFYNFANLLFLLYLSNFMTRGTYPPLSPILNSLFFSHNG